MPSHTPFVSPLDPETSRKRAEYVITEPFPLRWSVVIGEIVHDLRSALDQTVYDLTCINSGAPLDGTEFPIFDDEDAFFATSSKGVPERRSGLYKIRGLSDSAQTLIKGMQPFELRRTMTSDNEPVIALLHNLSVIDKHRTIHLCRWRTTAFSWRVLRDVHPVGAWTIPIGELKDGTVLGEWSPTTVDDEPDMEIKIGFEVAFTDTAGQLDGKGVIIVCEALSAGVERTIFHYLSGTLT